MNKRAYPLLVAALLLAGCGPTNFSDDPPAAAAPDAAPAADVASAPAEPAPAPAPAASSPAFSKPLVGGITGFPFTIKVTADKSPRAADGKVSRVIGFEFFDDAVPETDQKIADVFAAAGFARGLPSVKDGATRSVYTRAGEPDVLVWVRPDSPPGPQYGPMSPGAKGTVYMAWTTQ